MNKLKMKQCNEALESLDSHSTFHHRLNIPFQFQLIYEEVFEVLISFIRVNIVPNTHYAREK